MNVEDLYRRESRRVFATLIRLLGDFDLAEEALHDAFIAAMEQWPRDGVPDNPRAWLVSTGRFRAIDTIRKRSRFEKAITDFPIADGTIIDSPIDDRSIDDDSLRLIFTCCHPALSPDARAALTLREMCGLTTEEIARAFFTTAPHRAASSAQIKNPRRKIPYQVPSRDELPAARHGSSCDLPRVQRRLLGCHRRSVDAPICPAKRSARPPDRGAPAGAGCLGLLALMLLMSAERRHG